MFDEPAFLNQFSKCQRCAQPCEYFPPDVMPCCGKTLCYSCVQTIGQGTQCSLFKCIMCQEENFLNISSQGLLVNETVARLLVEPPIDYYWREQAEKLKQNINDLGDSVNKLMYEISNSDYIIKEKCSELRKQVHLTKQKRILEIEKHSENMIEQIDLYEQNCIRRYSRTKQSKQQVDKLVNKINSLIQQQKCFLNQMEIDDQQMISSVKMLNELKRKIEEKRKNEANSMFDNQVIKFEVNNALIDKELIGVLKHQDIACTV